jgi:hypothetical protein
MEAFLLDRPSLCIRAIMNHGADTCGVNFYTIPYLHYSGNFWAASCDYIVNLPPTKDQWRPHDPGFVEDYWFTKHSSEFWIGNFTNVTDFFGHKHISLFTIDANLYSTHAEYGIYQWIFDNNTLYTSGEKNSTVSVGQPPSKNLYDAGNLTDLWLDYMNSRSNLTQ